MLIADMQSVWSPFPAGIDSTLVLKIAHEQLGPNAVAVTAVSPTFPRSNSTARIGSPQRSARGMNWSTTDQLEIPAFVQNDAARCFHCKTDLYQIAGRTSRAARASQWIVDGTNLDDLGDDRPGIKAAREWGVRSPLVEAALSKADVRALARPGTFKLG